MNHYIVGHNERCIGCNTCQAACSNAHKAFGLQSHPRISVIKTSDISVISACHQCEGAPCAEVCPVQVIHHFGNFIYVDEKNCIGCKLCAYICPFGAIHPDGTSISGVAGISVDTPTYSKTISPTLDWEIGVHTVAVKCDVCFFDPQGPNCVRVCPTDAIEFVTEEDADDLSKELRVQAAEVLTQVLHEDASSTSQTGGEEITMTFGAVSIVLISIAISAVGAIVALLFKSNFSLNKNLSSVIGIVAALYGIYAGFLGMTGQGELVSYATPFPFASLSLLVNPLSGLLLFVLSLLALVAWIYGLSYMDEYKKQGAMTFGFFMHTFILSMALVVLADNAFWFLVFFELMSLTSYFLVTIEQSKASTHAGLMYMVMAHAGLLMIMAAFLMFGSQAGSLEFEAFRQTQLSPVLASTVFLLTFIGFGIKAGMIPFHSWLPLAHPSAPSNISALMSGGMIKIGIFGIVKVAFDLLQGSEQMIWWGIVIIGFGAVSSLLGIIYALVENDVKRFLAYSSVENIGIILLGVGVSLVGVASGNNVLAILGLAGGLFHLLNHAVFKGLLFLGAGSITFAAHTKNMELLGGLGRLMPITATCFLIGSLAISALPPLNGFVSEWLIYQGLFNSIMSEGIVVMIVSAVAIVALALTGALAVTCFVKAYGVSFAGSPRSDQAANAKEVPAPMKIAMLILAVFCVILGVGAHFIVPVFSSIAKATALSQGAEVTASVALVNPASSAFTSTFVIAVVLLIAILVARLIHNIFGGNQFGEKVALPWATGYKPDVEMAVTATTFATGVEHFYDFFYDLRRNLSSGKGGVARAFDSIVNGARNIEPVSDKYLVDDTVRDVESMSEKIRRIASGDFQKYVLYIVGALIVLLALAVIL